MIVTPITFHSEGLGLVGDLYTPDDLRPQERRAGIFRPLEAWTGPHMSPMVGSSAGCFTYPSRAGESARPSFSGGATWTQAAGRIRTCFRRSR